MTVFTIAQLLLGHHQSARSAVAAGLALAADVGQPQWGGYLAGVHAWLSEIRGVPGNR